MLVGWVYLGNGDWREPDGTLAQAMYGTGGWDGIIVGMGKWDEEVPPNYPRDLNAMADVEKLMSDEQFSRYAWQILETVEGKRLECRTYLAAPARQRCEAYVMVTSKEIV
jgi:hypothetical protein